MVTVSDWNVSINKGNASKVKIFGKVMLALIIVTVVECWCASIFLLMAADQKNLSDTWRTWARWFAGIEFGLVTLIMVISIVYIVDVEKKDDMHASLHATHAPPSAIVAVTPPSPSDTHVTPPASPKAPVPSGGGGSGLFT